MFNPVVYLINAVIFDLKNLPKIVEEWDKNPRIFEDHTHLALNILESILPKERVSQFLKLKTMIF